ncbi:MAG: LicD family protein, partial [Lachnospiraceae bacterium]|nr:LicD family protein [Lachnospiraceae bacterium]
MFFEREYFKPEIRDGFYVSSRMKRTWAATLEAFDAVRKVCETHGIRYCADWGTMLGAVRHGGFIPWDDDLDICMLRKDYMKFLKIAEEALPEGYAVLNMYTEPEYANLLTRVVNRKSLPNTVEEIEKSHGFPYIAGIDIYPLDYVNKDQKLEDAKWEAIRLIKAYTDIYDAKEIKLGKERGADNIREIARMFGFMIREGKPVRQQLYQMLDTAAAMYGEDQGDLVSTMSDETRGKPVPASYYRECIEIPFECTTISVPVLYDEMLEAKYSEYMHIVKNWDTHEYPVYKLIEDEVIRQGGSSIWSCYSQDKAKENLDNQRIFGRAVVSD